MIWNLIRRSAFSDWTACENASTIVAGASGLASIDRSGLPIRCPRPRFSVSSSSWHAFSTTRVMLPLSTASSIDDVSTRVRFSVSTLEKSIFGSALFAIRWLISERSWLSNSAISAGRSPLSVPRASRNKFCSSRTSVRLARSISRSPTLSRISENAPDSRCTARSRQSSSIFVISRADCRRLTVSVDVAFMRTVVYS